MRPLQLNKIIVFLIIEYCRLWSHVTDALKKHDVNDATHEKYLLEEEQRKGHKERKAKMVDWVPKLFERDEILGDWVYKHME